MKRILVIDPSVVGVGEVATLRGVDLVAGSIATVGDIYIPLDIPPMERPPAFDLKIEPLPERPRRDWEQRERRRRK